MTKTRATHSTPSTLGLAAALTLATRTTAATRQAQIDSPHPVLDGAWVLFVGEAGIYVRMGQPNADGVTHLPAYTLEEASRWAESDIDTALAECKADIAKEAAEVAESVAKMSYADALKQERDSHLSDGDSAPSGEMDPSLQDLLDQLMGGVQTGERATA